jgi:hypothetical protein
MNTNVEWDARKVFLPLPARVPTKRRQIGRLADVHIAIWLAGDTITDAERALLEREKERRKQNRRVASLGIMAGPEGMTPLQRAALRDWRAALAPCTIHAADDFRAVAKACTHVIACPRSSMVPPDMRDALTLARRRNVSVRIVLPDGKEG